MLSEVSAYQLSEWMAYEKKNGRIDKTWDQEALASLELRVQQLIEITLAANSEKGKTKFKPSRLPLPWETAESIAAKKKAPVRSGPRHEKSKEDFYRTLAERNRQRNITPESIAESKAKAKDKKSTKAGARWR